MQTLYLKFMSLCNNVLRINFSFISCLKEKCNLKII